MKVKRRVDEMRALTRLAVVFAVFAPMSAVIGADQDAAATRAAFLQIIDRPQVPLSGQVQSSTQANGIVQERFTYATEAGLRIPGVLTKPAAGAIRRPVVIALHGTGDSKEGLLGLLQAFSNQGFVAVAIDARYHGEHLQRGSGDYIDAIFLAYRTGYGHPLLYDTVWDVMRLVDYTATRPDVDATRIGLTGISKGGMETYLTSAVDPRIAVAVPMIGVQSFRWGLDHGAWQSRVETFQGAVDAAAGEAGSHVDASFVRKFYDRVVPGIYGRFDGPVMLPLIAPRPLLVINGDSDARTPLPGVRECADAASLAYKAAQAEDRFTLYVQANTGHAITPQAAQTAVAWFVKWLKP